MRRSTVLAAALGAALLVTNGLWAYRSVDFGITHSHQQVSLDETRRALAQALAIVDVLVADAGADREALIAAASAAWQAGEPFEKEGYVWVGGLGLRFAGEGRLVEVVSESP